MDDVHHSDDKTVPEPTDTPASGASSRRQFLFGGAVAGLGAAAAVTLDQARSQDKSHAPRGAAEPDIHGGDTVPFHGTHQAGIATAPQAHATFIALDLRAGRDRDRLRRWMRILTDDAARLTQGRAALADSEPELAEAPARLSVTFGFGPRFVAHAAAGRPGARPSWLRRLPAFTVDRLDPAYCDGDLLLQIASDDPVTVAHTARMLLKDSRSFATVRWTQSGFRRAHGSQPAGTTMRNLFGQVDGTANAALGSEEFDRVVWADTGWLAGGTSVVVRRIRMDLDTWDKLDRGGREQAVGRNLRTGAPLTGGADHDEPDFSATNAAGFPVIPEFSHVRRARSDDTEERIFRRAYNYDLAPSGTDISDSGLIFVSYQADIDRQFVPIQTRLDQLDLLNKWTTPIGSAVYAIPPGCAEGGYIGQTLLDD